MVHAKKLAKFWNELVSWKQVSQLVREKDAWDVIPLAEGKSSSEIQLVSKTPLDMARYMFMYKSLHVSADSRVIIEFITFALRLYIPFQLRSFKLISGIG